MFDKFIENIEDVAISKNKKGIRYFLRSNLTEESIKFINDILSKKITSYTQEDWENILKLAEHNRGVRQILSSQSVPKWVFMKFAPKFDDYSCCLKRNDLLDEEIANFLKIIGKEKVKEMMLEDPNLISGTVLSYFASHKDELEKYDYLPLRLMYRSVNGFDDIEHNFDTLFPDNENAMTEIVNNRYIMEKNRMKAFELGCNLENIIYPPRGEVASAVYASLAQTIFEFEQEENPEAFKSATDKLIYMIKNNLVSYSCQMDIIERYKESPKREYEKILKEVALNSKIDEVIAEIANITYGNQDIHEIAVYNKFGGEGTYNILKDRCVTPQAEKGLFVYFLTHTPDGNVLTTNTLKKAADWQDKNLNKLLALDFNDGARRKMEGNMGVYEFYYRFYVLLSNEIKHKPRAKMLALHLLTCDKEFNPENAKIKDGSGSFYINKFVINNHITNKYNHLGCIAEHEIKALDIVLPRCEEVIRCNKYLTEEQRKNQLETLHNYKESIMKIWKQEAIRRQFPEFFVESKLDGSSGMNDAFHFNIVRIVRSNDKKIDEFKDYISKLDNIDILNELKRNILNDIVDGVKSPNSAFLIPASAKCASIYDVISERVETLEKEAIEKFEKEEIEEER